MLQHIFLIAKTMYLETVRDRVILGASVLASISILFSLFVASISLDQGLRIIIDLGLSSIYLLQVFIVIFISSSLLQKEIERKTLFLFITKPIKRESLLLGKVLGIYATVVTISFVATALLSVALISKGGISFLPGVFTATALSLLELPLLILVSLFFSLFSSAILSALLSVAIFFIGHSTSILQAVIAKETFAPVIFLLKSLYYIVPNLEKYNIRNDVIYKVLPDGKLIFFVLVYTLVYGIFLFSLSRILFVKKEF